MATWGTAVAIAALLIAGGALYIRLRWRRSPQAYRAMIAVAAGYAIAGALLGAWVLHVLGPPAVKRGTETLAPIAAASPPLPSSVKPPIAGLPVLIPPLHYDLAHAILPDPKLTPGGGIPGATATEVCTPGWASEHRHVDLPRFRRRCWAAVTSRR